VLTLLSTLVTLSVLILVHEFGHFFAAKSVGILAPRFSLGFGPRVWGFRWGETEFVLSAIPLGGYVKMAGMEDDEASSTLEGGGPAPEEVPYERTFDSKSLWARAWVISAGVIMNLLFAVITFAVLAFFYGESLTPTTRVASPDPAKVAGTGAAELAKIPYGARVLSVGGTQVEVFEDVVEALVRAPGGPVQLTLENAPPVVLDLPSAQDRRAELVGALRASVDPVIGAVESGAPAARGGLREGDRVVSANGRPVRDWGELVETIQANPAKALAMEVERGGGRTSLTVTPDAVRGRNAEGERVTIGRLGVGPRQQPVYRKVGLLESIGVGFTQTWETTRLIVVTLKQLITGELSARNMGGLLTIGEASGESAQAGLGVFLGFLALFSVNLAVLNLLPIPILDGGHLMFLFIEAVRGRPLSVEARIRLSHVGLIIVVGLMLWANGNDVVRLIERHFGGG
jgi:regulator of sigma E protease